MEKAVKKLVILGASGHGKVVADIAVKNGYTDIVFLDDDPSLTTCAGYPVLGPISLLAETEGDVFAAIGNAGIRRKETERYPDRAFPTLIHPGAIIAPDVEIGSGSVVMAGAVINPGAVIGKGCIVNTCASVDHDCVLGDYCHVAPGAHLCGTVTVGAATWIGAGATVSNNLTICGGCMIGAGAVVTSDVPDHALMLGVPARRAGWACECGALLGEDLICRACGRRFLSPAPISSSSFSSPSKAEAQSISGTAGAALSR